MKKIIALYPLSGTTAAGTDTVSTGNIHGILRNVRCKFTTGTTTFVLTINDSDGIPIFVSETETGTLVEQVELAIRGVYSVVISSASADEDFEVRLEVEE
jgi:hypothetical protein